jgi:hypothetical protein
MDYLSLAIVAAVVSTLTQVLKTYVKLPGDATVLGLSLVAGFGYWLTKDSSVFKNFLEVLVVSNTIYGLLIKRFESENE